MICVFTIIQIYCLMTGAVSALASKLRGRGRGDKDSTVWIKLDNEVRWRAEELIQREFDSMATKLNDGIKNFILKNAVPAHRNYHDKSSMRDTKDIPFRHVLKENKETHKGPRRQGFIEVENNLLNHHRLTHNNHEVIFAVSQNNLEQLKDKLDDISNPFSESYGQHLTREQVGSLTSNPEGLQLLHTFLRTHYPDAHVISETMYGEYVTVTAPVAAWEHMFNTKFKIFGRPKFEKQNKLESSMGIDSSNGSDGSDGSDGMEYVLRAEEYSLPEELYDHILGVFKVADFPLVPKRRRVLTASQGSPSSPSQTMSTEAVERELSNPPIPSVTPQLLNNIYNIDSNIGHEYASQAVYETIEQVVSKADLVTFLDHFGIYNSSVVDHIRNVGGHYIKERCVDSNMCGEANLDIQWMMAISRNSPTWIWHSNTSESMTEWITNVATSLNPPKVFSISYGIREDAMPPLLMSTFNIEAQKLSILGITIVVSSGDDGVADQVAGKHQLGAKGCAYNPDWPSSSPYVLAVGATQGPEVHGVVKEVACQGDKGGVITSGGGFSNYYPLPSWQQPNVDSWKSQDNPYGIYNIHGRAYPDISALGHNYQVVINGTFYLESGTSASAPVVAAMISLVNAHRFSIGKGSLGWVNPALYELVRSGVMNVNDVNSGHNHCTAFGSVCCAQGFQATKGWDPVTGLGTLDFTEFNRTFVALGKALSTDAISVPSAAPTVAGAGMPTFSPTFVPTSQPTFKGTGWAYFNTYLSDSCDDNQVITSVSAMPTGICMPVYASPNNPVQMGTQMVECYGDGTASIKSFNDASCKSLISKYTFYPGCDLTETYYYSGAYTASSLLCQTSLPSPATDIDNYPLSKANNAQYIVARSFDTTSCKSSSLSSFMAMLANYCLPFSDSMGFICQTSVCPGYTRANPTSPPCVCSYQYNFPNFTIYPYSSSCQGDRIGVPFNTSCSGQGSSGSMDDDASSSYANNSYYYDSYSTMGSVSLFGDIILWSPPLPTSSAKKDALSVGAIAGIAVGSVAAAVGIGAVAYYMVNAHAAASAAAKVHVTVATVSSPSGAGGAGSTAGGILQAQPVSGTAAAAHGSSGYTMVPTEHVLVQPTT